MLASDLLTRVREVAAVPDAVTSAELLRHADAEIQERLLPMLRQIQEEYLVRVLDSNSLNGRISLPSRAMGAGVRLVQLFLAPIYRTLPRMDPARDIGPTGSALPIGFYFDGGGVVLLPVGSQGTCRVRYYARPGRLVDETAGATQITAVSVVGSTVQLTLAGGAPTAGLHDIISIGPAHQQVAIDAFATNTNPTVIQQSALLEMPQVGDWFTNLPDTTPLVALPEELSASVVLLTGARYLQSRAYLEEASAMENKALSSLQKQLELLRPRSDGNPKRLSGGVLSQLGNARTGFSWWRW